jgi:1-acyl-sn-glycerol-3-phosphate acyltransferase
MKKLCALKDFLYYHRETLQAGGVLMFYWLTKNFFKIAFIIYNRAEVRGIENCSVQGPCILASNHASHLDPPLVGAMFPGRLTFVAIEYLFRMPFIGFCIRHLGVIPITHDKASSAVEMLKLSLKLLQEGKKVILFPEGTRSWDGKLKDFEGGVAMLALKTGAPILPIFVEGTHRSMPRGSRFPKPTKLRITFGSLLHPEDLPEDLSGKAKREALLKKLEQRIREMGAE